MLTKQIYADRPRGSVGVTLHFRRIPAVINQIALAKKMALDDGW
jgi:hypothetical protein